MELATYLAYFTERTAGLPSVGKRNEYWRRLRPLLWKKTAAGMLTKFAKNSGN